MLRFHPAHLNLMMLCSIFALSSAIAAPLDESAYKLEYEIIDVGSLGGWITRARHVNDFGEVIGDAAMPDGFTHAYIWRDGQMEDLGTFGGVLSQGMKINDRHQAVGSVTGIAFPSSAFLYSNGESMIMPFDSATAVNLKGQVVGFLTLPYTGTHTGQASVVAILYENGTLTQLGMLPGGSYSGAHDINIRGEIVGGATTDGFNAEHAFLYRVGKMIDLGTLGGATSSANAINVWGHITGVAELNDGGDFSKQHAFLFRHGHMLDLGTVGADTISVGEDINIEDVIVGASYYSVSSPGRAFIYVHGKMRYLDELIDPESPLVSHVTINEATGINNLGWITANGYDSTSGLYGGYLLRPRLSHRHH